ncbi:MAG: PocR ligand-binding domain-containing protein [Methanomicrobiales archaeon]
MTTILIADDNPEILRLLESILAGYRYEVVSTTNGAEALETAVKNPPDLVISDTLMPIMDGFELCRHWKADEQLKYIPFIFYTATYIEPNAEKLAMALGAERFLIKPQKPDVLFRVVQEVLQEAQQKSNAAQAPVDEMELLRQYNAVLFHKLEKKFHDLENEIYKRKQAEEELHEKREELEAANRELTATGERVRLKLESLLEPGGDIDTLELGDIIETQQLQSLLENFSKITGMGTAVLDTKGNVLVATGWQDICTRFHRVNPVTAGFCTESDLHLAKNLRQGEYVAYKCRNNLWDVVTPLYIGNRHMGNIFTGQFFYEDEVAPESVFIVQAKKYSFDRDEYLAAFHRVPRFSREKVNELMDYLVKITGFISLLSYSNLELVRTATERDAYLHSLQLSEDRYRTLVENLPQKIFTKGLHSRYVTINENFARDLGIRPEDIMGKSDADLFPAQLAAKYLEGDVRIFKTGKTEEFEERYLLEGKETWVHTIKTAVRGRDGEIVGLLGVFWDITERKRVEEALHESARYTRNLIEVSLDPLVTISPEGKITDVNVATEKVTGYSREELIGTDFSDYFTEPEKAKEGYSKVFDDGVVRDYPLEIRHRDGKTTSVLYNATIYRHESGAVQGVFAAARDITERKRAEETLNRANRKLNLLYSITRHDINNQLTVLRGYFSILKKNLPDSSFKDYFMKIDASAERISAMIRFTKEYESIGVTTPTWQDCRTLVDIATKQAPLGKVAVKNSLPAGIEVFADPLIVKVCYNLIDNAVQHGGKITTIRFSAEKRGDDKVLVCEDDGDGIPAEEKEKIFERGYGKNTGLGLALAREILDITGITIIETGEQGKGARFEMTVPDGAWRRAGNGE